MTENLPGKITFTMILNHYYSNYKFYEPLGT
jgi:hypothetical protein